MKTTISKALYFQPQTEVSEVITEGFIAASLVEVKLNVEVDELINQSASDAQLVFNDDL